MRSWVSILPGVAVVGVVASVVAISASSAYGDHGTATGSAPASTAALPPRHRGAQTPMGVVTRLTVPTARSSDHAPRVGTAKGLGATGVARPLGPATSTPAPPAAIPETGGAVGCPAGPWPLPRSAVVPGSAGAVYLRSDGDGVALEVTHPGARATVYAGTLTSDTSLTVAPFHLESQDRFSLSGDGHVLSFQFVNHGALDGAHVTAPCATTLTLRTVSPTRTGRPHRGSLRPTIDGGVTVHRSR